MGYEHLRGAILFAAKCKRADGAGLCRTQSRANPNWGNISRYESSGDSYYNS
jgi:hypothetical protein